MNDEQKIVIKNETFEDTAVRELAKTGARCMCLIQFGRCKKEWCKTCEKNRSLSRCLSCLTDYDRQRYDNYRAEFYCDYSARPDAFMRHKEYKRYYTRIFVAMFVIILFILGSLCLAGDRPNGYKKVATQEEVDYETSIEIQEAILTVQRNIKDVNEDGKVNCVDHAIMFYLYWSEYCGVCEIVQNIKPGVMNHLFVQVKYKDKWIEIEPWTAVPGDYMMYKCWEPDTYDSRYNLYGKTDEWLSRCKKSVLIFEVYR